MVRERSALVLPTLVALAAVIGFGYSYQLASTWGMLLTALLVVGTGYELGGAVLHELRYRRVR